MYFKFTSQLLKKKVMIVKTQSLLSFMLIASNFSFMFLQCSLYARLRLWKKLHWRAIIEKLRAISIYHVILIYSFFGELNYKINKLPLMSIFNNT